jgi:tetratricopeptide (TPR) repeat protein
MKRSAGLFLVAALALVACTKKKAPAPVVEKSKRPTTTSWSIAGENLDADIESRLAGDIGKPKQALALVRLLLARGQFLARITDYEKADEIAQTVAKNAPRSADALMARASVESALHRWDDAAKDLDAVSMLGAEPTAVAAVRGSIAMARGQYDEAAKYIHDDVSDASELATAGILAGLRQKDADAERLFAKARKSFRDVSPFPVAWTAFERARWLEARGKSDEARQWYEEALDAIPVYAHAAVHLALGDPPERAIARLEPLTKTSDDPDVLAGIADAHVRLKHEADAKNYGAQARARYEELLLRHPEAFADHAARFFLRGGDVARALELARANAKNRATEEAVDLWLGAATAANAKEDVCSAATKPDGLAYVTPERKRLASATLVPCK